MKNNKQNLSGITLISLVVTVIVLLILAGISVSMLTGENGIILNAGNAKEQTEILKEKELIGTAAIQIVNKSKFREITLVGLNKELKKMDTSMPTNIEYDEETGLFYVTFTNSGRVYQVDRNGNVVYLGNETELKNKASIIATPESNLEPQLIQFIDLKIETFIGLEDDEIFVHYAWTNNENETPESSKYISATCTVNANKKRRSASITSEDTQEGNYYLWVQLVFNENTITEKFGPYAVKDHTTLVAANRETSASSGFLGNTEIPRNKIRSVTINNSFGTHDSDERSWDVSASNDGRYLAWSKEITDETDGTYYDVTIEGKGGVVANTNSAYLFANIGSGLTNKEVTITGLEYLDTGLVTNMTRMFIGSNNLVNLNLNTWNTRNLKNMNSMFWGCNNLKVLEIENFNTSNATDFGSMFRDCFSLEKLDVSKWDTSKATTMRRNVLWM